MSFQLINVSWLIHPNVMVGNGWLPIPITWLVVGTCEMSLQLVNMSSLLSNSYLGRVPMGGPMKMFKGTYTQSWLF